MVYLRTHLTFGKCAQNAAGNITHTFEMAAFVHMCKKDRCRCATGLSQDPNTHICQTLPEKRDMEGNECSGEVML